MNYNEYLQNERPYQEYGCNFLLERKHACLFYKPGKGKAICDYETLPTPAGIKTIGDIKEGDLIFDAYGQPTKVLKVYPQGECDIYRVYTMDGQYVDCNSEHLWEVTTPFYNKPRIITTEKLYDTLLDGRKSPFYLTLHSTDFNYQVTNNLEIPDIEYAYLVGLFLGNGCLTEKALSYSTNDQEVIDNINKILNTQGIKNKANFTWYFPCVPYISRNSQIVTRFQTANIMPEELVNANAYTKFVPSIFKYNTKEIRTALIQGLMDSDGNINADNIRCRCSNCFMSERLARDLAWLFRSLGYKCTITQTSREGAFLIVPSIPKREMHRFFRLSKHLNKIPKVIKEVKYYNRLYFSRVEKLDKKAPMTCFLVDNPRHLYMVKDFIPTHNTYPAVKAIQEIELAKKRDIKVLVLSTAAAIKMMWLVDIDTQKIMPKNTEYMSFTKAVQDKVKPALIKELWDVIVIDECHHIKAHNTKISKLVYQLTKKCEYVFGLTGTPRGNSDIDIYCQFHNMNISGWGDISYTFFVNNCCEVDTKFIRGIAIKTPTAINEKYKGGFEKNIAMYSQRKDYDEEDNMPELNVNVVKLPFVPSKEYLQVEQGVLQMGEYETTLNKLTAICKLQQLANGFVYVTDDYDEEKRTFKLEGDNKKHEWLHNNLQNNSVIVYRYAEDYIQLVETVTKANKTFTNSVADFKSGKASILLLQCSQSESFNLQQCSNLIFYTMDYSFINYDQMLHRVYRMGQKEQVNITILINDGSIENKIWNAVNQKQTLSQLFYAIKGDV